MPEQKENAITTNNVSLQALPRGTRKPPGTYTYGDHDNEIKIRGTSSGYVRGTGRGPTNILTGLYAKPSISRSLAFFHTLSNLGQRKNR